MSLQADVGDAVKTVTWIAAFLVLAEVGAQVLPYVPGYRGSVVAKNFEEGSSIETKLRADVTNPNLAPAAVVRAGWMGDKVAEGEALLSADPNARLDVVIYGNSVGNEVARAIRRISPETKVLGIAGPGVPISHGYGVYQIGKRPPSRATVIAMNEGVVYKMIGMTADTLQSIPQPVLYPLYAVEDDVLVRKATPAIQSFEELQRALTTEPELWRRHLDVLGENDPTFQEWLYARHFTEYSLFGRLARRGYQVSRLLEEAGKRPNYRTGFDPQDEASIATKGVLRQFVLDLRAAGERPIVILSDQFGARDALKDLVLPTLQELNVDWIHSRDYCSQNDRHLYKDPLHVVDACNDKIARDVIDFAMQ